MKFMEEKAKYFIDNLSKGSVRRFKMMIKWMILALICGVGIGFVGIAFLYSVRQVTDFRMAHGWIIWLLPFCGLLIMLIYDKFANDDHDRGTNLVLMAILTEEKIPLNMTPIIFVSTILTHLFGGSAGREGAALQIGGSLGEFFGRLLRFDEADRKIAIMCGMSAAFSALLGTPLAATIFAMEVVTVGIMQYTALVPCAISALTAHYLAVHFGFESMHFTITDIPGASIPTFIIIGILGILCAVLSMVFCSLLQQSHTVFVNVIKRKYRRIFLGGLVIAVLTWLIGNQDYNGAGVEVIARALQGDVVWYVFILKIIFTVITLSAGYKGGEIIPTLYVGATFGCAFGTITGFSPTLSAAVAMGAVFCGVTNSPITSILICFELFGLEALPYYLIAIAISYMLSGYFGLYRAQKFVYSKYKADYLQDRKK
ncbi:chloride channel protein [Eubacterium oxidoreducens]|uniref:H+/Cl-antiporter ClcA n=1 Tax=Eubacterium oxidoreducens TaxID=1732 RepID=A0A1G6BM32_EUBOX|nr:chloride channel protein [Eubacterium oxidoreducens]SDB21671.1 H+/Cl-antiporter ClcA [Eubacterium oxidoreducens]